ncbi:hemagglutinin repeat-containing protein [Massilia sp. CF038]|uniref:two-partner secretion domain-containing protein n=1 Tax=Massilia sp. CF038 TaxID=1881045 RepID=UPI00091857CE|nr:hemagglutinin repeat-containing protein [Massilia sp. CF038]SHH62989.1 filamentous hemagglutinin [Massilia sp. CF038]
MNKHLYRIIFNERRGQMMVVAENADSPGKAASGDGAATGPFDAGPGSVLTAALRPLCAAVMAALGLSMLVAAPAQAQIKADPRAPGNQRATVLTTANGTALVNIQTPSAAGVSRNTYTQFDVTAQGAVLNNSRTDSPTQIGGWVQGNPWLAGGAARVILNEVNSANPSQLRGYLEVAGQRAEVIIANAAGVQIDGGGFINASRVTITTGQAQMNNGALDGFLVQGGTVSVNGLGLDASQTDFTTILTRALQLNAGIWAKDLRVVTGANQFDAAGAAGQGGNILPVAPVGNANGVALDVAHLGGMYAGKITLIGTEAGFGVRNAGAMSATAGPLVLNANGWISNSGSIYSAADTAVTSHGDITGAGLIAAQNNAAILAQGPGAHIDAAAGSAFVAGMNADGSLRNSGALTMSATDAMALHGTVAAAGQADINATQFDLTGSRISGAQLSINASAGSIDAGRASISSQGALALGAAGDLRTDGAQVTADSLKVSAANLSNVGGRIAQFGNGDLTLALPGTLDNTGGQIASNSNNLALRATTLLNAAGLIEHAGSGALTMDASTVSAQQGAIRANGSLAINAADIDHRGASIIAQDVTIASNTLDNRAGAIESKGAASIRTGTLNNAAGAVIGHAGLAVDSGNVDNGGGSMVANGGDLRLHAANFDNTAGTVYAGGNLDLSAANVSNTGVIAAGANASISATRLDSSATGLLGAGIRADGAMAQSGSLRVTTTQSLAAHGQNLAAGSAVLAGTSVDVSGSQTGATDVALRASVDNVNTSGAVVSATGALSVSTSQTLMNAGGKLSGGQLDLHATSVDNANGTLMQTGAGDTAIKLTGALDNSGGTIAAAHALTVSAPTLNNTRGLIQAGDGALTLNTDSLVNAQGTLSTGASMALGSSGDLHNDGVLYAGQDQSITVGGTFSNTGSVAAKGDVTITAASVHSSAGSLIGAGLRADGSMGQSGKLTVTASGALHANGSNLAAGDAALQGASVDLSDSQTSAANIALTATNGAVSTARAVIGTQGTLSVAATALDNQAGVLNAGQLKLNTGSLNNSHGTLIQSGSGNTAIATNGAIDNTAGRIAVNSSNLTLQAASLVNSDGRIEHAGSGTLAIDSATLTGQRGQIISNGNLAITANSIDHRDALTGAQHISITAASLDNRNGQLSQLGLGQASINVNSIDNRTGTIESNGGATIAASTIDNRGGRIAAGGDAVIAASSALDNSAGTIEAGKHLNVSGGALDNTGGSVQAYAGNAALAVADLTNTGGSIYAGANLDATAANITSTGVIAAHGDTTISATSINASAASLIGAGINTNGSYAQSGALTVTTTQSLAAHGQNLAAGSASLNGASVNLDGSLTSAANVTLNAGAGNVSTRGATVSTAGALTVNASAQLLNQAGTLSAGQLAVHVTGLDNAGGTIIQTAGGDTTVNMAGTLDNTAGRIAVNSANLTLGAGTLVNTDGVIEHAGSASLAINAGTLNDQRGTIIGNGSVNITAAAFNHDAGTTFGKNLTVQAASLSNRAGHVNSAGAMNVNVTGQLDNRTGDISGNGVVSVNAGALDNNHGAITSAQSLNVGSLGALDNSDGIITAAHTVAVSAQALDNTRGTLQAGEGALSVSAASLNNTDGALNAGTDLTLATSADLINNSVIYAGRDQALNIGGTLNNTGSVAAQRDLTINAGAVMSSPSGLLGAGVKADGSLAQAGNLTVNAVNALQATGRNVAAGNAALSGGSVNLNGSQTGATNIALTATNGNVNTAQAQIGTPGALSVNALAGTLNNQQGKLSANQLALNVANLNNDHGSVVQSGNGDTSISMGGTLDNTAGRIAVNSSNLSLNAGTLINTDGTLEHAGSGELAISAGTLSGQRGQITANKALSVNAGNIDHRDAVSVAQQISIASTNLDNRNGQIAQLGSGTASVSASGTLNNSAGDIAANGAVLVSGGTLNNTGGHIAAAGNTGIHASVALDNTNGFIGAGAQLDVSGGNVDNAGGNLQALGGNATLNIGNLSNAAGSIYAAGNLVTSAANVNNSGNLYAAGAQNLTASGALVNSGLIAAHGDTTIHAASVNSSSTSLLAAGMNLDGSMAQTGHLTVSATSGLAAHGQNLAPDSVTLHGASVDVSGSQVSAATIGLNATAGNLITSDAVVATTGSLNLSASGTLINQRGNLSANTLVAQLGALDNTQGLIVQTGSGDIDLSMGGTLNNTAGRIAVNSANLTLGAGTLVNTDGKIDHAGTGTLAINAGSVSGARGQITGNGNLTITAGNIDHRDASTIAKNITISAASLDNRQGEITQLGTGATSMTTSGALDNRGGAIASNGNTSISTGSLNNQGGVVQAAGAAALSIGASGTLDNSNAGLIAGGGNTTLLGGTVLNQSGEVTAGGTLGVTALQGMNNSKGVLVANADVALVAGALDNTAGKLASVHGNISATTSGATVNDSGLIQAAGNVALRNGGLSNKQAAGNAAAGTIVATNVSIDSNGQALDNRVGTIAASQLLDVRSGALNNDAGLLQGGTGLLLNTGSAALSNSNGASHPGVAGGIVSGGTAALNLGSWNNSAGFFGASGAVTGTTGQISNNQGGQIVGETSIELNIGGLNNQGGQIQALGDLALRAGAGTIDNRQSLIRSGATLTVSAGTIDNSNTNGANQGLEAKDVVLSAANLSNIAGAVRADNNTSFTGNGSLDNTQGLISAGNTLSINDASVSRTLNLSNTAGTMIAGQNTTIRAGSFGGEGSTLSLGNLTLDLAGSLVLGGAGQISANGNTTLILGGNLTNIGKVQTGGTLAITAQNITNMASGDISAYATRLTAYGEVSNRGVIDGVITQVNAGSVYNIGSGRIYGDHVSIGAGALVNDFEGGAAGTIAARGRLDIGAQSIVNNEHALILSGGDMAIGGALDGNGYATGRAASVTNVSATIEALGNLSMNTSQLANLNAHFSTQMSAPVSSGSFVEFEGKGSGIRYAQGTPGVYTYDDQSLHLHTPENNYEEWNRYDITRTTRQTEVVSSDPGRIVSGGALSISADSILNRDSHILAGGTLSIAGALNNESTTGQLITRDQGTVTANWRVHHKGNDSSGNSTTGYAPPEQIQTISLGTARLESGVGGTSNGGSVPGAVGANSVNGSASAAGAAGATAKQAAIIKVSTSVGAVDSASGQTAAGAQGTGGRSSTDRTGGAGQHGQIDGAVGAQAGANGGAAGPGAVAAMALQLAGNGVANQQADNAAGAAVPQGANHGAIVSAVIRAVAGSQANAAAASAGPGKADIAVASNSGATVPPVAKVGRMAQVALSNPSGGAQIVRTATPTTRIPDASLFRINRSNTASYLIETDPRFANYRTWLGSDYMLSQIELDPNVTQKRLGDGYYEQTLIREQVAQLTGRRFLGDYTSDDTEYRALMDAGVAYAKTWNLRPGVALSDAQMAVLSSDIVWLVEKDVTLADGSVQKALVPQVYVRVRDGDIDGSGALLSGKDVDLQITGDLVNSGTIAGRDVVRLTADNVQNLGGRIHGDAVSVAAKNDLNNIGGTISANSLLVATAGRDINIETTTRSASSAVGGNSFSRTTTDRVAGLYVTGEGATGTGTLVATAGRDIKLTAGQISNAAKDGDTVLDAGRNIELGTVLNASANNLNWDAKNYQKDGSTSEVGSQINGAGNIALKAGTDISLRAANVQAGGALAAQAGGDINVVAGVATASLAYASQHTDTGFLKKKTVTTTGSSDSTSALGSSLGGATVGLMAGHDLSVVGSSVIGDGATTLAAGNNVTIAAATETYTSASHVEVKKSGISSAGFSVSYGTRTNTVDQTADGVTQSGQARSTVGSVAGDVGITAGNAIKVSGADLGAGHDLALTGASVTVDAGLDKGTGSATTKTTQDGLTLALSSSVITAVEAVKTLKEAQKAKDGRVSAMAAASAAMAVANAAAAVGEAANGPVARLSLTVGHSESETTQTTATSTNSGSVLSAGNDIHISASGAGKDSNVMIAGSELNAKNDIVLKADNQVNLVAAQDLESQHSKSKSMSAAAGIAVEFGKGGASFGVTGSLSGSRGHEDGEGTTQLNSRVTAGEKVSIVSGGDTNIRGAVVSGAQVVADVKGNLNLESLQDTATFDGKNQSASISGTYGFGASVNGSFSQTSIKSDYASVQEQTAIRAGDKGFQLTVSGNTELKGAAISSTAAGAEHSSLDTGTLTSSDIANHSTMKASSIGLAGSMSSGGSGKQEGGKDAGPAGSNLINSGKDGSQASLSGAAAISEKDASVTRSGVGAGAIVIRDNAGQMAASGKDADATISGTNRNVVTGQDTGGALANNFDRQAVQTTLEVTVSFGAAAAKAVGDYASKQLMEAYTLRQAASDEADPKKAAEMLERSAQLEANWKEDGTARVALHTLVGGIAGGTSGALGAGTTAVALPAIAEKIDQLDAPAGLKKALTLAAGATIGATAGGNVGAATAANEVANNRQLHPNEVKWIADNAKYFAQQLNGGKSPTQAQVAEAEKILAQQAYHDVQNGAPALSDTNLAITAHAFLRNAHGMLPETGYMFQATADQKANSAMYSQYAAQTAAFYQKNGLAVPTAKQVEAGNAKDAADREKVKSRTKVAAVSAAAIATAPAAVAGGTVLVTECLVNVVLCVNKAGIIIADAMAEVPHGIGIVGGAGAAGTKAALNAEISAEVKVASSVAGEGGAGRATQKIGSLMFSEDAALASVGAKAAGQDAKAAKVADDALAVCTNGSCFVAGTLIQTASGLQAIETFRGGELVLSRHEETGEIGYRPVVATKQTHDQELYEVVVRNAQGATEILHTTAEHPFWVTGKGWLKAALLEGGHELVSRDNDVALNVVSKRAVGETATVYNIQVHEHSTYHVGKLGVWVHNADCCVLGAEGGAAIAEAGTAATGRIQSRINVANGRTATTPLRDSGSPVSAGFDHVLEGHFGMPISNSRSVFSITPAELKNILQSERVVNSPVIALGDGQFVRTVDVGRVIGLTTVKEGGAATSVLKVFTDRAGNLITTFPVKGGKR